VGCGEMIRAPLSGARPAPDNYSKNISYCKNYRGRAIEAYRSPNRHSRNLLRRSMVRFRFEAMPASKRIRGRKPDRHPVAAGPMPRLR
jgi:hypothetical protein